MVRVQIQLPEEVHERARRICAAREISFAELSRRGLEYMLSVYADDDGSAEWTPPVARRLGWRGLGDARLKEIAQRSEAEAALSRRRR